MKKLYAVLPFLLAASLLRAQTTAGDFTATDCSTVNHNLYTELNAGKVVVLVWVMPCGNCISDAKAAFDAVQSFSSSNPGKVSYWMSDDAGNNTCSSLTSWASTNGIGPSGMTLFDNTGNAIDEAAYGGTGMPHVVVMAGNDHHIYYNQKNGSNDGSAITAAIVQAIAATGIPTLSSSASDLRLYPNPTNGRLTVNYSLDCSSDVSVDILNVIGTRVKTVALGRQLPGSHVFDTDLGSQLQAGVYILRLTAGQSCRMIKFTISY